MQNADNSLLDQLY